MSDEPLKFFAYTACRKRASQYPLRPIQRTCVADFGPSLSMFKEAAVIEFSYKIMYVCTSAENFFVTSWPQEMENQWCHREISLRLTK